MLTTPQVAATYHAPMPRWEPAEVARVVKATVLGSLLGAVLAVLAGARRNAR